MKLRKRKIAGGLRMILPVLAFLMYILFSSVPVASAAIPAECAAGNHQYEEIRRIQETEIKDGEINYKCTRCGNPYTEILFASSHIWGEWIIDKSPTCTEPGERHRTCTRARSHDEQEEIAALGHDYTESVTTQPLCETEGLKTFTCSRCKDSYTKPIPALGHDYHESITKEPSCLSEGLVTFICGNNHEHTYKENIEAIGSHDFGEWEVETPAGEGTAGMEVRVCARDGFRETRKISELTASTEQSYNVLDIILITASVGAFVMFSVVIGRYVRCLNYIKKRRKDVQHLNELREMVEKIYDFK